MASVQAIVALAAVAFFATVHSSQAAVIDFTNAAAWGGANGQVSFTSLTLYDGVQVTVTATSGTLTFNSGADVHPSCAATTGLSCQGDGLGVVDDEVTYGSERLLVSFNKVVSVSELGFLDLFGYPNQSGDVAAEIARWTVIHPSPTPTQSGSVTGTDTTTTLGYKLVATSYTNVSGIRYYAGPPENSDYAVAKIKIAVPEPATLLLSGFGVAVVGAFRRRRLA